MFLYIHCCVYMYCSNVELRFQSMGVAEVVGEGGIGREHDVSK